MFTYFFTGSVVRIQKNHTGLPKAASRVASFARARKMLVAAACFGIACCATAQTADRARMVDVPFAATHSDIAFSMSSGARQNVACDESTICTAPADKPAAMRFVLQVQRVAEVLQKGAMNLYPDLAQRVPGLVDGRFDIYVVDDDEAGSASSANGRIALNSALGAWQPYDDWLAFVIAREMGHVIARHHEENSSAHLTTSVIMNIMLPGSGLLKYALSAAGAGIAAISQRDEQALEADSIALDLLKAADFQLREVSLSLRTAPVFPDDSSWSRFFRKSSDYLFADFRSSALVFASAVETPHRIAPPVQGNRP